MFKSKIEGSVIIKRPCEEVWAYVADVNNTREWLPNLMGSKQTPADRSGIGTKRWYQFQYLGRRFENHYVIAAYEVRKRIEFTSLPGSAIPSWGEYRIESGKDGTKLTMKFVPYVESLLRLVPAPLVGWFYNRTLKSSLRNIKTMLETPTPYLLTEGDDRRHVWWRGTSHACS